LERAHIAALALIALVALPALTVRLGDCPRPWFDEGLRTNVARTLLERGEYGTFTSNGLEPFPPIPSSGPIEIGAVAASFACLGIGTAQARLPSVVFSLLALVLLYGVAQWLWGIDVALVAVLCVLAAPRVGGVSLLQLGRQTLAEPTALALALASLSALFASWTHPSRALPVLAGALAALAAISKGQIAVGLFPALVAGGWAQSRGTGRRWRSWALPLALGAAATGLAWQALALTVRTAAHHEEHVATLAAQILSHVLVVGDRRLPATAWLALALLAAGVAAAVASLRRQPPPFAWEARRCAELALVVFIAATGSWYVSASLGWPRYAHPAMVLSALFLGRQLAEIVRRHGLVRRGRLPVGPASLALAALALFNAAFALHRCPPAAEAQGMADYIRAVVPRSARIESSEWEVDALSAHWLFHHPPAAQVCAAVEQHGRAEPFHLSYDLLAADPDYLLKGPFSDWVRIYDDEVIAAEFASELELGPYHLYRRRRGG